MQKQRKVYVQRYIKSRLEDCLPYILEEIEDGDEWMYATELGVDIDVIDFFVKK